MTRITPPAETQNEPLDVVARTPGGTGGHEFATLLTEVAAESNFTAGAVNKSTGAAGPFQFVKNTWLAMVHQYGAGMGIKPELVGKIALDAKGRLKVADPQALDDLLALRHDPVLATKMAGKYLDEGKAQLKQALHREPSETEVHLTFLLGPAGAAHLIRTAEAEPDKPVDQVVGTAATSNRSLFLASDGTPRTAAQSVAFLAQKYQADKARATRYLRAMTAPPTAKIDA